METGLIEPRPILQSSRSPVSPPASPLMRRSIAFSRRRGFDSIWREPLLFFELMSSSASRFALVSNDQRGRYLRYTSEKKKRLSSTCFDDRIASTFGYSTNSVPRDFLLFFFSRVGYLPRVADRISCKRRILLNRIRIVSAKRANARNIENVTPRQSSTRFCDRIFTNCVALALESFSEYIRRLFLLRFFLIKLRVYGFARPGLDLMFNYLVIFTLFLSLSRMIYRGAGIVALQEKPLADFPERLSSCTYNPSRTGDARIGIRDVQLINVWLIDYISNNPIIQRPLSRNLVS